MKITEGGLVQWKVGDAHHTGRVLMFGEGHLSVRQFSRIDIVKHSYTGELHPVSIYDLSPYPSEPIPEPSK